MFRHLLESRFLNELFIGRMDLNKGFLALTSSMEPLLRNPFTPCRPKRAKNQRPSRLSINSYNHVVIIHAPTILVTICAL